MTVLTPRPKCKAVLLTPTLYFRLPETDDSLALALQAFEDKYGHGLIRRMPSITRTLVDRSRNQAVDEAQKVYDAEYYVFADHDMFYPTGDVKYWREVTKSNMPDRFGKVNFFERLLSHGPEYKIVGGLYVSKLNGIEYQCDSGHNDKSWNERMNKGELRGLIPQKWIATGAMRVATQLLRDMRDIAMKKMPDIMPIDYKKEWGYFSRSIHHQIGEDVSFCDRARTHLGVQTFADCDLRCWHERRIWV